MLLNAHAKPSQAKPTQAMPRDVVLDSHSHKPYIVEQCELPGPLQTLITKLETMSTQDIAAGIEGFARRVSTVWQGLPGLCLFLPFGILATALGSNVSAPAMEPQCDSGSCSR